MPSSVTQDAIDRLDDAVKRSKRTTSVRFPVAFVRDVTTKSYSPPLSRLLRDRGETRLRVYLLLRMMATGHPYEKTVSNRELAQVMGLPDPEAAGMRRVAKAVQDLEELKLIERTLRSGHVPKSRVLNPAGDGSDWSDKKIGNVYVTVPIELWRRGWLLHLSGRAIAFFIILRELTGGRDKTGIYVDAVRKRQYGLSEDTWGRATRELVSVGLLTVDRHGQAHQGEHRLRNFYQLDLARLQDDPFVPRDVLSSLAGDAHELR